MSDNPIRRVVIDFSDGILERDIDLGDFGTVTSISIQCSWTGLNAADAFVMQEMREERQLNWIPIEALKWTMTQPIDSCLLINNGFVCKYAGLKINKGSCTTGILTVAIISSTKK